MPLSGADKWVQWLFWPEQIRTRLESVAGSRRWGRRPTWKRGRAGGSGRNGPEGARTSKGRAPGRPSAQRTRGPSPAPRPGPHAHAHISVAPRRPGAPQETGTEGFHTMNLSH